jgi:hypothetical protein
MSACIKPGGYFLAAGMADGARTAAYHGLQDVEGGFAGCRLCECTCGCLVYTTGAYSDQSTDLHIETEALRRSLNAQIA